MPSAHEIVSLGPNNITTAINTTLNPGLESRNYAEMSRRWPLVEALMGGTTAMRAAATTYLPQDDKESSGNYTARLERSFLLNAFARTVRSMTGKPFSKPIVLREGADPRLAEMVEDIDKEGRKLNLFAEEVFRTAMQYGLSHILVDMPKSTKTNPTLADDLAERRRPYWVHYKPRQLIGYRSQRVGSQQMLTQIRLRETTMEDDGDYGEKEVLRIREIGLTYYKIWRQDTVNGQTVWVIEDEGPMTLGFIPFFTVYTGRVGFQLANPPLEDLAWMNVAHWQSSSDQRQILHVARVPILFSSGLGEDASKLIIGPNRHIQGPENATMGYVEHSGAAIGSGRQDLLDLEDNMRLMGLELLMPMNGGGQTATAKALDYADINSPLQFMALGLQDTIDLALWASAQWMKSSGEAKVKVNTDFGITLRDAADVQGLIQARIAGEISRETFWRELKRRNILADDFDEKAENILVKAEEEEALKQAAETFKQQAAARVPGAPNGGTPGIGSDVK